MPIEELHRRKRKMNFAILATLFAFCVLLFGITIVKIQTQNTKKAAALSALPAVSNAADSTPTAAPALGKPFTQTQ